MATKREQRVEMGDLMRMRKRRGRERGRGIQTYIRFPVSLPGITWFTMWKESLRKRHVSEAMIS